MSMRHDEEHIYLLMLDCIINRGSKRKGKQGGITMNDKKEEQ